MLTTHEIQRLRHEWSELPAEVVVRRALALAPGRAVLSTNFRPYEAVLLHLATRVEATLPILWVDHGFNRPATYRHAEDLRGRLGLNLQTFVPARTSAWYEAVHGPLALDDEDALRRFSAEFKLEPFRRGLRTLQPQVWLTALRRTQNPGRAELDLISFDHGFGVVKVNPLLDWTDAQLEAYLEQHQLPNEWDYFDPAKADEKRECGLHAAWGREVAA
ncbi:MAG: phosphoadenosine phosphosulfate reductase family protein [Verrucomicrobia bacterium]|nr:phosphoadenosine phosphosulfate reductase family protein [Verrucomicrobiota bacterium]